MGRYPHMGAHCRHNLPSMRGRVLTLPSVNPVFWVPKTDNARSSTYKTVAWFFHGRRVLVMSGGHTRLGVHTRAGTFPSEYEGGPNVEIGPAGELGSGISTAVNLCSHSRVPVDMKTSLKSKMRNPSYNLKTGETIP